MRTFKQILLESRLFEGYTEEQWRKLDSRTKAQYIKDHPNSKYAQKKVVNKSNVSSSPNKTSNSNKTPELNLDKINDKQKVKLAENPNTSSETLDKLLNYKIDNFFDNVDIQKNIAKNPNTSSETLEKLFKKTASGTVYPYIVKNPNVSKKTLIRIASQEGSYIYYNMVDNPNLSKEDIKEIRSEVKKLKERERQEKEKYKIKKSEISQEAKTAISKKPIIPVGDFENSENSDEVYSYYNLSQAENPDIRWYVAKNKNTPKDILRWLSQDKDEYVRDSAINTLRKYHS